MNPLVKALLIGGGSVLANNVTRNLTGDDIFGNIVDLLGGGEGRGAQDSSGSVAASPVNPAASQTLQSAPATKPVPNVDPNAMRQQYAASLMKGGDRSSAPVKPTTKPGGNATQAANSSGNSPYGPKALGLPSNFEELWAMMPTGEQIKSGVSKVGEAFTTPMDMGQYGKVFDMPNFNDIIDSVIKRWKTPSTPETPPALGSLNLGVP